MCESASRTTNFTAKMVRTPAKCARPGHSLSTGEEYEGSKFGGFGDYFRRKKIKLQNKDAEIRQQSADRPNLFKGIVCHVNGYTQPSLNDLHTMIVQHGGGFLQYLDGKTMVTHIIASNLTPKKKEEFKRYRIVKPAWIVDSIKAGKLLPWDAYRVVDEGVGQKVLGFENGQITSEANRKAQGYREQTDTSWYTSQLKSQALQKPLAQTVTPTAEDIEDEDEYSTPEVTSSMEEALREADKDVSLPEDPNRAEGPAVGEESASTLQTPPPSSPPREGNEAETHGESVRTTAKVEESLSDRRPAPAFWDGFNEAEFSHAVVRNSEVMKNVSPEKLASMTAEEHNAMLLSDPNIRKSTVVNPDFLEQFYRESRLHHLSTWKADLKSQLQALAAEKTSSQKTKQKRLPGQRRYIMHVDFDSFFAAVSLRQCPQYKDKPAVVAHGGGSGSEIASCNYPARKFGISNGMWMKRAQELCPEVKILPYDFPGYEAASRKFYDAIMATGGLVQSVSIDEALIDISTLCIADSGSDGVQRHEGAINREQSKADEIGQKLRDEVLEKTGCAVSVGIGANILQAKVALRKAKPAGQYQLKPDDVLDFIGALEVTRLPGVAWSLGGKLEEIGIKLVKDIRDTSKQKLMTTLGPKTGEKMYEYARGIDKTEVGDQVVRKSVSAEVNWGVRFENQAQVDEFMHGLCGELNKRLVKERVKGKQLTMKVMKRAAGAPRDPPKHLGHGKCDVFNKSLQLGVATNDHAVITKEAIAMMKTFAVSPGELRGIGIQMQKLETLKKGVDGTDLSSQRKLQFLAEQRSRAPTEKPRAAADPIQDDTKTPEKQRIPNANQPSAAFKPVDTGTPTKKPLNVLGTQFVLPTQVDPSVLAELPPDIRSRLAKHASRVSGSAHKVEVGKETDSDVSSRAQSPAVVIPPQSQLDPSILEALPEEVRNEVLGFYKSPGNRSEKRGDQALLPQSPRKLRTLPPPARQPVKRGRGRPPGSRILGGLSRNSGNYGESSTLTQANFVHRHHLVDDSAGTDSEQEAEELDPEVLAALPEDLRQEVLAQQRQARLQRTGGIDLTMHQRSKAARKRKADDEGALDRHFALPPRPAKPTFTSKKLSELPDLRNAVSAWFKEFSDEAPYEDDVAALITYLKAVVIEERDISKAVAVIKWMAWVIDQGEESTPEEVLDGWKEALGTMQQEVQEAATSRALGKLRFD